MTLKTEGDIYRHLYDPSIEDKTRYDRETLCIWIRATIHSAISQGIRLGQQMENDRISEIIRKG